jgi:hypothetical protein
MNFGTILDDALTYTRNGIFNNMNRWMNLIIAVLCLGLPMNGYVMRIYRDENPAPEIENWGTLFIDGLKLMLVGLIYAIPVFIVAAITYSSIILALLSGNTPRMDSAMMSGWSPNIGLILLMYVVEIAVGVIVPIASIRFARTNSFSEAFNIGTIIEYIAKIGWINYIIALILVALVIGIPIALLVFGFILLGGIVMLVFRVSTMVILGFISALILIILILAPLFAVFQARFMTQIYDSAAPAA